VGKSAFIVGMAEPRFRRSRPVKEKLSPERNTLYGILRLKVSRDGETRSPCATFAARICTANPCGAV
jgi:hypothetical protein